ncbi:hypothetical protein HWV62_13385 [Athelia sp. TMB]|nr:hypothetical protein HWV62_13385 [Athelia sp. TMB]
MSEAVKWYSQLKSTFTGGIVPVGVAMNTTQPYLEGNYSLPSYSQYKSGVVLTTGSASAVPTQSGGAAQGHTADGALALPAHLGLAVVAALVGGAARVFL